MPIQRWYGRDHARTGSAEDRHKKDGCSPTATSCWFIKDEGVEFVDVRFCDLPGVMQHFTVPVESFDEVFDDGLMFDGSSIRGFQAIHESDMRSSRTRPRRTSTRSAREDAGRQLLHPRPAHRRGLQPRPAQHRQEGRGLPQQTGIADTAYFGPEAEFYIFDNVRFETSRTRASTTSTPMEGAWNTGEEEAGNRGYKVRYKGGYFPVPPSTTSPTCATEMVSSSIEVRHHRRAAAPRGRHRRPGEINYRFDELLAAPTT